MCTTGLDFSCYKLITLHHLSFVEPDISSLLVRIFIINFSVKSMT